MLKYILDSVIVAEFLFTNNDTRRHTNIYPIHPPLAYFLRVLQDYLVGQLPHIIHLDANTIESVEQCATQMASFVQRYSEPWFSKWIDPLSLLQSGSPLYPRQIEELNQAIESNVNSEWIELTKELFKIA